MQLYNTINERQFNERFNKMVGSQGVSYADTFPMRVRTGKEYFNYMRNDLARKYAGVLLYGGAKPGSSLAPRYAYAHMSDPQRAALSYLHEADDATVASALQRCDQVRAIPRSAVLLFGESHEFDRAPALQPKFTQHQSLSSSDTIFNAMDVDDYSSLQHTPSRSLNSSIVLNAPASASQSMSLKPSGKRRKNK